VKVFLVENQILPDKKFKIDFFDRESKYFPTFLLDKLVIRQGILCNKKIWIATLYQKIDRKIPFDFIAL
jgi:hypothetical protein